MVTSVACAVTRERSTGSLMKTAAERVRYIEDRKLDTRRTERLWVHDSWTHRAIYQVPVDALVLNADNRRFRAERMWAEAQLGRALDPEIDRRTSAR